MQIEHRIINRQQPPFIVAEISCNHKQDFGIAKELILEAKKCGVNAVKFQIYKPESLTLDKNLSKLYEKTYMPWDWTEKLFELCRQLYLIPFTSVDCVKGVEFLENIGCPAYKIGSYEIYHKILIDKVLETGKPVIISTGMASYSYLNHLSIRFSALKTMILKCVSQYPSPVDKYNLLTIPDMRDNFGMEVGLSDHTTGIGVSIASIALGATMIERHFTLKRNGSLDDCVSLEPDEMKLLVKSCMDAWMSLGSVDYGINGDRSNLRSLYCIKDIKSGERFSSDNIGILRPNNGISPTQYDNFIDKKAICDIKKGEPLHMRHISE